MAKGMRVRERHDIGALGVDFEAPLAAALGQAPAPLRQEQRTGYGLTGRLMDRKGKS